MVAKKTGNNKFLKQLNKAVVLDLIRVNKTISRAQISEFTGLSPTASGIIVTNLLEEGYIHETGEGDSRGGRRPVLLELKPHSYYSIGMDIDVGCINSMLIDITGQLIHEDSMILPRNCDYQCALETIAGVVEAVTDRTGINRRKLLGIGISVPGMVDSETFTVTLAPNLGWENMNIKQDMEKMTGMSVYVENEAMSSAICENWLGSCQSVDNFVCINVKSGIGAGIFTGGKLCRGSGGSAGEVGHIVVD